jgi:hypothetical protein
MKFYPVKTCVQGIAGCLGVEFNQFLYLLGGQGARGRWLGQCARAGGRLDEHLDVVRADRRWCDGRFTAGLQRRVRYAADMPELSKDYAPFGVNCVGDLTPALYLFWAMNPGCPSVTLSPGFDLGALGHHEASTGALLVIGGHQVVRNVARLGAARTRQWRQNDTVLEGVWTQLSGFEQL